MVHGEVTRGRAEPAGVDALSPVEEAGSRSCRRPANPHRRIPRSCGLGPPVPRYWTALRVRERDRQSVQISPKDNTSVTSTTESTTLPSSQDLGDMERALPIRTHCALSRRWSATRYRETGRGENEKLMLGALEKACSMRLKEGQRSRRASIAKVENVSLRKNLLPIIAIGDLHAPKKAGALSETAESALKDYWRDHTFYYAINGVIASCWYTIWGKPYDSGERKRKRLEWNGSVYIRLGIICFLPTPTDTNDATMPVFSYVLHSFKNEVILG
ncbi:hypothetical protein AAG570_000372 [Ranatra chinensis]|uniref:Uncharacterized protein n=1 Tax=Ranatra chinensis TaxID=642074 RepID=A0ABD0YX63_9HEMI